jgi:pyruvate/2-oxoglutarate/acetoin dehydrogenase E1 component
MAETLFFNALRAAIDEEMARDSAVMVMGEDVGQEIWRTAGIRYADRRK